MKTQLGHYVAMNAYARVTFQPVALKVFPALPMVMVRSHIPGRPAVDTLTS